MGSTFGKCHICGGGAERKTILVSGTIGAVLAFVFFMPLGVLLLFVGDVVTIIGLGLLLFAVFLARTRKVIRCQRCRAILADRH